MQAQRAVAIRKLKQQRFDVLIVGGGATGAGIALDAASRGLKVALVERGDFSQGTSSRSTKLIHGGVRYLEQAVKKLDRGQLQLVRDALRERKTLIKIAPHLTRPLPLLTPIYSSWQVPYYYAGLKMYDLLAGSTNLKASQFLPANHAKARFPMLKGEGLRGAVLYYDGQFDDARMNIALILTATEHGAVAANHVEVINLLKRNGKICGAAVRDRLDSQTWDVEAKLVINATGPFADTIRQMDEPDAVRLLSTSSGTHIVLDARFSPPDTGLLIPQTEDGRVLFLLPWLGHTLVGTTDNPAPLTDSPEATEEDITYILRHVQKYFSLPVHRDDVRAAWTGLRPLVSGDAASSTASLSRDHVINMSNSNLLTITGGKWTTYRKMALDAVDTAITSANLQPKRSSQTENLILIGGDGYHKSASRELTTGFRLEPDVAEHLNRAYGSRAPLVAQLATEGFSERLAKGHPYIEAEVVYAVTHEMACTPEDVLAHRMRLSFLDEGAAERAYPRVREIMTSIKQVQVPVDTTR